MQKLSEKAAAFIARKPTLIGQVKGFRFYEHPTRGDESPLIVIGPDGKVRTSDFWDLPSVEEL